MVARKFISAAGRGPAPSKFQYRPYGTELSPRPAAHRAALKRRYPAERRAARKASSCRFNDWWNLRLR
jgi:hypothetical protein